MKITDYLKNNIVYLDGGTGTMLQARGLSAGEMPEWWNITHADVVTEIHKEYFDAGSNVVSANTFGANLVNYSQEELKAVVKAAVENVKRARDESVGTQEKWVALDIGPTGRMLAPYGDLDFEEAVSIFAETVKLAVLFGVDLIFIQTMNDSYETKAALLAAKENSDLPVFVSNAYGEDGKLMTGASPSAMVSMLEGMGADAIGVNCSLGPKALKRVVDEYLLYSSVPVILKPNAGLPKSVNGRTEFDVDSQEFSDDMEKFLKDGVKIAGGCCGTTPDYISKLTQKTKGIVSGEIAKKNRTVVSSYTHSVEFGDVPILIGERINPTGKKKFKEALREGDIDYILKEGISQQEKGVHILDVNVGLPEIDEAKMLETAVCELQAIIDLPLQIDTGDIYAMEKALRRYNGKALINSVNGKEESMNSVLPLAKKYGGVVVALTLDENGIPEKAEARLEIAKRILKKAKEYGLAEKDIIFDPLALTVSADSTAGLETIKAVRLIKEELGCHTSLGVSNVSFGLPERDVINSSFFTLAMWQGLSAAIMNPYSLDMMKAYHAFCALTALDKNCEKYISFASTLPKMAEASVNATDKGEEFYKSELQRAIIKGLKESAGKLSGELLKTMTPLSIVQNEIIPALDIVGVGFENKSVYLPELLMSAEAAKAAFEQIKANASVKNTEEKGPVVLATVKGDIHDIGKNIVKLLLENYGFRVYDLGRDVKPEIIRDEAIRLGAPLVGLSALMTTTVPAMEETIKLIKESVPSCKVIVGGAVLTKEYADLIGADKYAKDAMETVRYAEVIICDK